MGAILSKVLSSLGVNLVEKVGNIVDNIHTSKEEKLIIEAELEKAKMQFEKDADELELNFEKEYTERSRLDSKQDAWLPRNIRPLTLIVTIIIFTLLSFSASIWPDFTIPDGIIETYKMWGMMALGFYFSSRGIEKASKIIMKKK